MSEGSHVFVVEESAAGTRLDRFLAARVPDCSRTLLSRLVASGHVTIGGRPALPSRRLRVGEEVGCVLPAATASTVAAEDLPLTILHEDDDVVVLDKAPGVIVHPGAGVNSGTLVNALLFHLGDRLRGVGGERRPGIVHRLDKGTSGVLVVAKTSAAHAHLGAQFAQRTVEKVYFALVVGVPGASSGRVDAPIGRDPSRRTRMSIQAPVRGRSALTEWRRAEVYGRSAALLEVVLHTGRTHQIRVHLASLGHPVAGDASYGGANLSSVRVPAARVALEMLRRPALHAWRLSFDSPSTGMRLSFESAVPPDIVAVLAALSALNPESPAQG